jgi:hypothetical protein
MQISTRGLMLVLVLGSLFLLAFGLYVVQDTLKTSAHRYAVAFRTPSGNIIGGSVDNTLPVLRSVFPQPKANTLVPPPPPVTPNFYLGDSDHPIGG